MFEVLSEGEQAFYALELPNAMDDDTLEAFSKQPDCQELASKIARSLATVGVREYSSFCSAVHGYLARFDMMQERRAESGVPEISAPSLIDTLREVPDPHKIYQQHVTPTPQKMLDNVGKVAIFGLGAAVFAVGAIAGGEAADKYLQNHAYINHIATGLSAIVGGATGLSLGFVASNLVEMPFTRRRERQTTEANDTLVQQVSQYLAQH